MIDWFRNQTEFQRIAHYIEMNPAKSGLAATPEEFAWSSARPIDNRPQVANLPHTVANLHMGGPQTNGRNSRNFNP
jgi:hypothetical protein